MPGSEGSVATEAQSTRPRPPVMSWRTTNRRHAGQRRVCRSACKQLSADSLTPDLAPDNVPLHGVDLQRVEGFNASCRSWASSSMVEQLTLNQPVQGSSPWGLTTTTGTEITVHTRESFAGQQSFVRRGEVSELADEHDLGSCAARRGSSSLLFPTRAEGTRCSRAGIHQSGRANGGQYGKAA